MSTNQSSSIQNQPAVYFFKECKSGLLIPQTTGQIRYPTAILPNRPPILTQQITTDFLLSQEAQDHISNQQTHWKDS